MAAPLPPVTGHLSLEETLWKIGASALGVREFGFQDDERVAGFRTHDLAAFAGDVVSFAVPPLFLVRTVLDRQGWREAPTLQAAMLAFSIVGCFPMVAATTRLYLSIRGAAYAERLAASAAYVHLSRAGAVAAGIQTTIAAPLMIFQTGMAGANITGNLALIGWAVATGKERDFAAERGELLRSSLQLLPLGAMFYRPLNNTVWPRREMVRATKITVERLQTVDAPLLLTRRNAMNPFPQKGPIENPYKPRVTDTTTPDGVRTVTLDYRGVPRPRGRLPADVGDVQITVAMVMDTAPLALDKPTFLTRMAEQWGHQLMLKAGVPRIVLRGVENIPQGPITVAQMTHSNPKDTMAAPALGPSVGLMISQLAKAGLRWIPGMRQAMQCNLSNPTGRGYLERSQAHLDRPGMPAGISPANLNYTIGNRADRPAIMPVRSLPQGHLEAMGGAGIRYERRTADKPIRMKEGKKKVVFVKKGEEYVTWEPTGADLFLPHMGAFNQAVHTGTPLVPLTHRYLKDGTIEYTWHRPMEVVRPTGDKRVDERAAADLHKALIARLTGEIIPRSDTLRIYHPFHYRKNRLPVPVELALRAGRAIASKFSG